MTNEPRAAAVEQETGRLESFSDGVFAVAITVLVFDGHVPHLPAAAISVTALGTALLKQWPSYLTFMTSFATGRDRAAWTRCSGSGIARDTSHASDTNHTS